MSSSEQDPILAFLEEQLQKLNHRYKEVDSLIGECRLKMQELEAEQLTMLNKVERAEAAVNAYLGDTPKVEPEVRDDVEEQIREAADAAIQRLRGGGQKAEAVAQPMVGETTAPKPSLTVHRQRDRMSAEEEGYRDFLKEKILEVVANEPFVGSATQKEVSEAIGKPEMADTKKSDHRVLKDAFTELVIEGALEKEPDAVWNFPDREPPSGVKFPGRKAILYKLKSPRESETKEGDSTQHQQSQSAARQ